MSTIPGIPSWRAVIPTTEAESTAQPGLSRIQRRHRIWIALSLLAGAILAASGGGEPIYFIAAAGATLLYAAGIQGRHDSHRTQLVAAGAINALLGAALAVIAIWRASGHPPDAIPWPGGLLAAAALIAASAALLRHYLVVPDRATRALALVAGLVLATLIAVMLAFGTAGAAAAVTVIVWLALALALAALEAVWRRWINAAPARRPSLSVLLICCNEADRIEQCLRPLAGWADEIVVLDSGSDDGTVEIAQRYTDRVIRTDWAGYGRQKQRALELCSGDWVLNLDADEYIQPSLKREIDAWLASGTAHAAFRICWVSKVFGRPVFFGADGRYHKRLFRRRGARFNDADVHEDIIIGGRVARLGGAVVHDTFRDYEHLKRKFTRYALISAERIRARGSTTGPILAWLRALLSFLLLYIRRLGVLDGRRGLLMAVVYAVYTFDKYAAAWSDKD